MTDKQKTVIAEQLNKANGLPLLPGVYIMHGKNDEIIYVGKAKQLKNRVSQYFRPGTAHTPKVAKMVENVKWFEYIICDSEFEALILECSLIKKHSPKYNILLKDDKGYHYLKITRGKRPALEYVKLKENDGAEYLGPYNSGWVVRQTLQEARHIFKLADCNRRFDVRSKPCLNFHIGLCSAPCAAKISMPEYAESVEAATDFIKRGGCSASKLDDLRRRMESAADNLDFELAARLRDRISAIEKIGQKQKVVAPEEQEMDVFAFVNGGGLSAVEVFRFRSGRLGDREQHIIDSSEEKSVLRAAFLKSFYTVRKDIPPVILLDGEIQDIELIQQWLSDMRGKKCVIRIPRQGQRFETVEMCSKNAAEYLSAHIERNGRETAALDELSALLGLSSAPRRIEAYDISHTAGKANVGGMTLFVDGRPEKSGYRRFKIKGFLGQDDYRSMAEVLERRFTEYQKGTGGFDILPDLILLDGGKGQISAVRPILKKMAIDVALFGMVKDSKHRTRAIAADGGDISIKANRKAYTLITTIQDETHRYAIAYHHKTAARQAFESELTSIDGIGKKRAESLLKTLKTMKRIREATVEELAAVKGVGDAAAKQIYAYFHD